MVGKRLAIRLEDIYRPQFLASIRQGEGVGEVVCAIQTLDAGNDRMANELRDVLRLPGIHKEIDMTNDLKGKIEDSWGDIVGDFFKALITGAMMHYWLSAPGWAIFAVIFVMDTLYEVKRQIILTK